MNDGWVYDPNLSVPTSSIRGGYTKGNFKILVSDGEEWFILYNGRIEKGSYPSLQMAKDSAW